MGGGVENTIEGWKTEFLHLSESNPRYILGERRPEEFCEDALDLWRRRRHFIDLRGDVED